MMGSNQGPPYDRQSKVFKGVRFVLLGFDAIPKSQVLKELVDGGGVDVGHYGPSCTHVIVDKLAYDDPICVAARNDGKIVVSSLWVDHSSDVGMLIDYSSVMYRPLKDLNGIPGAKSLIICLTGYQRQDRDDIMTMVGLMGATFSKPLVAHKVTHLICYKFEGEKYELAKKFKRMKIVNHRWLEDCLKAWEIVPEENYGLSGYELETLEAEAKDSEDEADGYATKNQVEKTAGAHQPLVLKQEVLGSPLNSYASKSFGTSINMISAAGKNSPNQAPTSHIATGEPSNPYNRVEIPAAAGNKFVSTSEGADKSPHCDAEKFSTLSYSRKTPGRTPTSNYSRENASDFNSASKLGKLNLGEGAKKSPHSDAEKFSTLSYLRKTPGRTPTSNCSRENASDLNSASKLNKLNLDEHFDITSSTTAQVTDGAVLADFRTSKGSVLHSEEDKHGSSGKRKMDAVCGSLKLPKTSHNTEEQVLKNPMVASGSKGLENIIMKGPPVETTNRPSPGNSASRFNEMAALSPVKGSPSNIAARKSLTSNRKLVTCHTPVSNNNASEDMGGKNLEANQMSVKSTKTDTLGTEPEIQEFDKGRQEHAIHEIQVLHNEVQEAKIAFPGIERSNVEKSNSSFNVDITGASSESSSKLHRKKSVGKKLLGVKQKLGKENSANQKGSMYLKNSAPSNADHITFDSHEFLHCESFEKATLAGNASKEIDMEKNGISSNNLAGNKSFSVDDETEPPEDKEDTIRENSKEVDQDKVVIQNNTEEELPQMDRDYDKVEGRTKCENLVCGDKVQVEKHTNAETSLNQAKTKGRKCLLGKLKKNIAVSDRENLINTVTGEKSEGDLLKADQTVDNDITRKAQESSSCGDNPLGKSVIVKNLAKENVARGKKRPSGKTKKGSVLTGAQLAEKKTLNEEGLTSEMENEKLEIEESHPAGKTKKRAIMSELENTKEAEKENMQIHAGDQNTSHGNMQMKKSASKCRTSQPKAADSDSAPMQGKVVTKTEPMWFMLSGHRLQRKEFQKVIRGLKGKVCRDSHQWSYQATHLIVPDPLKRTEKFFAAAASGRWILKTDYLSASHQAGKFLEEEPYEWHKKGLTEDGAINLEAPRKWRLLKERTGHGAFYGMKIIVYGECIAPPLDTLKRVVKAGDGTILATSPPYTRFLGSGVDFAVVSPGMPRVDMWVQEFLRNEIPCVVADYLVEYVCKTGYPLDRHVQYGTHSWAERSLEKLKDRLQEIVEPSTPEHCKFTDTPCEACGSRDRGDVMLICGDETGSTGCGVGMHIDCCDPPLQDVPEEDWFCPKCSKKENSKGSQQKGTKRKKASASKRR